MTGGEVRSLSDPSNELLNIFGIGTSPAGIPVGNRAAMMCSPSYSAIRIISDTVAQLPVHVVRRTASGDRERLRDHPIEVFMNSFANPWTSGAEFRRNMTATALLEGRGLARVIKVRGVPKELHQIVGTVDCNPQTSEPTYKTQAKDGTAQTLQYGDVIDVAALGGDAPAKLACEAIAMALFLEKFGRDLFAANGRPSGLLIFKAKVDPVTAKAARDQWLADVKDGLPAVLGGDVSYTPLVMTSTDSQYIELRRNQVMEILRFFGLPPTMAGELADASLNNSENMARDFLKFGLSPWLSRWSDALSRALLSPAERATTYVTFEVNAIVAADLKSRMESYQRAVGGPFLTANEVRGLEDRSKLADESADKLNPVQGAAPQGTAKETANA
ncbi:phage portal protein [Mesorhizobium sp. M0933]|uniref:phage portal protein n=1 Tax=Mesorhizobium sp. M0933 TaxID=2957030 RepID=UPI003337E239